MRVIDALDDPRRLRSESILVRIDDRVSDELPPGFDRTAFSDVLSLLGIERC